MCLFRVIFSEPIENTFSSSSRKRGDLMDERCIRFSHNDLAAIADNFSVANQIGRGGFASVYYGERNGQVGGYTEVSYLYVCKLPTRLNNRLHLKMFSCL